MEAQFDILALHFELLEARGITTSDPGNRRKLRDTGLTDGLRIVLETDGRVAPADFLRHVHQALSPIDGFDLSPLFEDSDCEQPPADGPDLATFWLLRVPGISPAEFGQSHFDLPTICAIASASNRLNRICPSWVSSLRRSSRTAIANRVRKTVPGTFGK